MLRVTTPATAAPSFFTASQISTTVRPRLSGAAASDDARLLEIVEEITREGEVIATGNPGTLYYQTYTELIQVRKWNTRLYLQATPIGAVTSVKFDTDDALVEGTESENFTVYPGYLYREDGWDTGAPGWTVVYAGGYWLPSMGTSPPAAISAFVSAAGEDRRAKHLRAAVLRAVQSRWARDTSPDPELKSESIGGMSRAWAGGGTSGNPILSPASVAAFVAEGMNRRIM